MKTKLNPEVYLTAMEEVEDGNGHCYTCNAIRRAGGSVDDIKFYQNLFELSSMNTFHERIWVTMPESEWKYDIYQLRMMALALAYTIAKAKRNKKAY